MQSAHGKWEPGGLNNNVESISLYQVGIFKRSQISLSQIFRFCRCRLKGRRGHLVSIANHREMTFLHFMLSTRWRSNDTRTFIGLYHKSWSRLCASFINISLKRYTIPIVVADTCDTAQGKDALKGNFLMLCDGFIGRL